MGWSSYLYYRLMTMLRGQLTTLVYAKMLALPAADATDSSAMSLMGTDVQKIAESFYYIVVELIPSFIQVVVALYLLYVQLGAVCVAPVIVTISKCHREKQTRVGFWRRMLTVKIQSRLVFQLCSLDISPRDKVLGLRLSSAVSTTHLRSSDL